jgi:hypothetical protein
MSAPRPTATGPGRSRAGYDAWRATARYAAPAAHAESPPHRSRDPQVRSPVAAAADRVRRAAGESNAAAEDEENAGEARAIGDSRPSAL